MGDQDQTNDQSHDGQQQTDGQTPPGDGSQTPGQTDGQSGDGGQSRDAGQSDGTQQQTQTPGVQAGGYKLSLTEAQRKKLVEEGVLELSDEQYTGGVRHQVETLRKRASAAEKKLSDIAAAQAEADRKSLEEQNRYKELYEQERQARETERAARKDDLVRSRFLLAAHAKGFVDPDGAFVLAKSLSGFGAVAVDDAGTVSGLDGLIETLSKDKPYLIAQPQEKPKPQSVGSASNPAPQTPPAPKTLSEAGDRLEQALRSGSI
ncbi:MAG: hypothetical protein ACE149_14415 [Armatimonadota bacterium]